jgi:hypothetical protein
MVIESSRRLVAGRFSVIAYLVLFSASAPEASFLPAARSAVALNHHIARLRPGLDHSRGVKDEGPNSGGTRSSELWFRARGPVHGASAAAGHELRGTMKLFQPLQLAFDPSRQQPHYAQSQSGICALRDPPPRGFCCSGQKYPCVHCAELVGVVPA